MLPLVAPKHVAGSEDVLTAKGAAGSVMVVEAVATQELLSVIVTVCTPALSPDATFDVLVELLQAKVYPGVPPLTVADRTPSAPPKQLTLICVSNTITIGEG
jgi:hypothetical protein